MGAYTKTVGTVLLAHQAVTHPDTVKSSAQDVSTKLAALITMFHASVEAVANTNPGSFLVQISASSSGDEDWVTIQQFTAMVSTADTELLDAVEAAGATVLEVSDTTGFVAGDNLYLQDVSVLANSEWAKCQEIVTNTSINVIDGITNAKAINDVAWNDAEIFVCSLDLAGISRLRVVFQHEGAAGANVHIKALMTTADSFG